MLSSGLSASSTAKDASRSRWCATPRAGSAGRSSTSSPSRQAAPSRSALELLVEVFECGTVIEQHRADGRHHPLLRFSVKRRGDLVERVVPFFEDHPLRTAKKHDFERFALVLQLMQGGRHRTEEGLALIASITEEMNRRQRSRFLESSEAIRQPALTD